MQLFIYLSFYDVLFVVGGDYMTTLHISLREHEQWLLLSQNRIERCPH